MASAIIREYLDQASVALCEGRAVALFRIGTLQPFMRKGRRYKHPTTGEEGKSAKRPDVRFAATPIMKDALGKMPRKAQRKLTQS